MSLVSNDSEHVIVVPGCHFAPTASAGSATTVSGDKVEGDLAQEGEVASGGAAAHATVVLTEGDVEHPMQRDCLEIVGLDGPRRHRLCQNEVVADLRQMRPSVERISRIGMDTSRHVFQLHGVNAAEVPVLRKKLRREEMVTFFEKLPQR
jgi:hypothetical protein